MGFGSIVGVVGGVSRSRVVRVYCQLEDGSIWEGDTQKLYCTCNPNMEISAEYGSFSLFHTDVLIENFDSVKQIKELLESNPDDFLEKIIDPEAYKPTELGAKIIRNINPHEDDAQKLYKSLKTIEKRAKWFDASRLLGYSDVDGDPATIVASVLKESIKGSIPNSVMGLGSMVKPVFQFDKKIPENLQSLINSIFEGYVKAYPSVDDGQTKEQILKIICFFIDLAALLSNQ